MQAIFGDDLVRTILITDESKSSRKMNRVMLSKLGLKVVEVVGGGLHIFNHVKASLIGNSLGKCDGIDMILMTVNLVQNGEPEIVHRIRQIGFKGIIVCVIGHKSSEVAINLKDKGADAVVLKPITRDNFLRTIKGVIHGNPDVLSKNRGAEVVYEAQVEIKLSNDTNFSLPHHLAIFRDIKFSPVGLKTLRILVVDDSMSCRKRNHEILHKFGHLVIEADCGLVASQMVRNSLTAMAFGSPKGGYDVILMSNVIKGTDGPHTAQTMRENGFVGIILGLMSNPNPIDQAHFRECGADDVLAKPLTEESFYTSITEKAAGKKKEFVLSHTKVPLNQPLNLKILLVESNEALRKRYEKLIASCGNIVVTVLKESDVFIEIERAKHRPFSLVVISDNHNHRLNAQDVVHSLRQLGFDGQVLCISAVEVSGTDAEALYAKGVSSITAPPLTRARFLEAIDVMGLDRPAAADDVVKAAPARDTLSQQQQAVVEDIGGEQEVADAARIHALEGFEENACSLLQQPFEQSAADDDIDDVEFAEVGEDEGDKGNQEWPQRRTENPRGDLRKQQRRKFRRDAKKQLEIKLQMEQQEEQQRRQQELLAAKQTQRDKERLWQQLHELKQQQRNDLENEQLRQLLHYQQRHPVDKHKLWCHGYSRQQQMQQQEDGRQYLSLSQHGSFLLNGSSSSIIDTSQLIQPSTELCDPRLHVLSQLAALRDGGRWKQIVGTARSRVGTPPPLPAGDPERKEAPPKKWVSRLGSERQNGRAPNPTSIIVSAVKHSASANAVDAGRSTYDTFKYPERRNGDGDGDGDGGRNKGTLNEAVNNRPSPSPSPQLCASAPYYDDARAAAALVPLAQRLTHPPPCLDIPRSLSNPSLAHAPDGSFGGSGPSSPFERSSANSLLSRPQSRGNPIFRRIPSGEFQLMDQQEGSTFAQRPKSAKPAQQSDLNEKISERSFNSSGQLISVSLENGKEADGKNSSGMFLFQTDIENSRFSTPACSPLASPPTSPNKSHQNLPHDNYPLHAQPPSAQVDSETARAVSDYSVGRTAQNITRSIETWSLGDGAASRPSTAGAMLRSASSHVASTPGYRPTTPAGTGDTGITMHKYNAMASMQLGTHSYSISSSQFASPTRGSSAGANRNASLLQQPSVVIATASATTVITAVGPRDGQGRLLAPKSTRSGLFGRQQQQRQQQLLQHDAQGWEAAERQLPIISSPTRGVRIIVRK